ncbi:hypothetical protein CRG98_038623 [Punica granatum]|uniref:Uncharacterized protein n=1 Tax=Punica granatum TaxID=22663 RepID=A0A2I0IAR5_PUNGR|nr:hypothetical protein CRG98_038623 [Punica granatum]
MQGAMIPEQQDPSSGDESETVVYVIYFHSTLRVPVNPCHSDIDDDEVPDKISIYTIHALHVEDDSSHSHIPLPPPVLTLRPHDLPQLMGFGCSGSSIYMIGGRLENRWSEVVDGLGYPWFPVPSYYDGASYLVAYDLAQEKGATEIIPVRRPRYGKVKGCRGITGATDPRGRDSRRG